MKEKHHWTEDWCLSGEECGKKERVILNSLETSETSVVEPPVKKRLAPCQLEPTEECPPVLPAPGAGGKFIHSGWQWARARIYAAIYRNAGSEARLNAFRKCGEDAWLARGKHNTDEWKIVSNYCHDRLCQVCAQRRADRMRDAVKSIVAGRPMSFITITLKGNKDDLKKTIDRIYTSFRALRQLENWKNRVNGGVAFLETKWNPARRHWHTHLHIIADCTFYPQKELSSDWHAVTGDSFIVDIRRIKEERTAIRYVAKYASKPLSAAILREPDIVDEFIKSIKGRRLATCFGEWYGTALGNVELTEDEADEIEQNKYEKIIPLSLAIDYARSGDEEWRKILSNLGIWRMKLDSSA